MQRISDYLEVKYYQSTYISIHLLDDKRTRLDQAVISPTSSITNYDFPSLNTSVTICCSYPPWNAEDTASMHIVWIGAICKIFYLLAKYGLKQMFALLCGLLKTNTCSFCRRSLVRWTLRSHGYLYGMVEEIYCRLFIQLSSSLFQYSDAAEAS